LEKRKQENVLYDLQDLEVKNPLPKKIQILEQKFDRDNLKISSTSPKSPLEKEQQQRKAQRAKNGTDIMLTGDQIQGRSSMLQGEVQVLDQQKKKPNFYETQAPSQQESVLQTTQPPKDPKHMTREQHVQFLTEKYLKKSSSQAESQPRRKSSKHRFSDANLQTIKTLKHQNPYLKQDLTERVQQARKSSGSRQGKVLVVQPSQGGYLT